MNQNNKTFLFYYQNMLTGGIETYLIRIIRKLKEKENRIIWFTYAEREIDESFKNELIDGYIEIVEIGRNLFSGIKIPDLKFDINEEVFAIAFSPIDYLQLDSLKRKYANVHIDSVYWVPHFRGKVYFIEYFMFWPICIIIQRVVAGIIKELDENNNIFYVNESHAKAYMNRYNYTIKNIDKKLSNYCTTDVRVFNEELAVKRSKRDIFNVITVGRFDFPHKAYILGLIKVYGEMKEQHKNLNLTIIGYGKDENKVIKEIGKLSSEAKKDVNFVGKVDYDKLHQYFEGANLNIDVAGAIIEGALTGLISIPVRHYCEDCEGYGFLPEASNKITSDAPGIPINELIEKVLNMNQENYIDMSRKSYNTYAKNGTENSILSILDYKNVNPRKVVSGKKLCFIKCYLIYIRLCRVILHKIRYLLSKI